MFNFEIISVITLTFIFLAAGKRQTPLITECDVKGIMIDMLRHCKDKPRVIVPGGNHG